MTARSQEGEEEGEGEQGKTECSLAHGAVGMGRDSGSPESTLQAMG